MEHAEFEKISKKYKNRDLKEELEWASNHVHPGYLNKSDAQFLRWLCASALKRLYDEE